MKLQEVFTDESKWTRGAYAVDKGEGHVDATSDSACKWCLHGAVQKICNSVAGDISMETFIDKAICELFPDRLPKRHALAITPYFNDHSDTTFADIQAVAKRADELATA
jgi:hypothetical protein